MTVTTLVLLTDLGLVLHDTDPKVWSSDLKIRFINEALDALASVRPDAFAVTEDLTLIASTPKQEIHITGYRLLNVMMNDAGAPIKKTTIEALNDTVPAWTVTEDSAIESFAFNEENPTVFWVQPVPNAALVIVVTYAKEPTIVTTDSITLGISDIYIPAVKNYVLSKCYGMSTQGADTTKSKQYMDDFYKVLGLKFQSDATLKQVQEE
jgi:hypothetical protein